MHKKAKMFLATNEVPTEEELAFEPPPLFVYADYEATQDEDSPILTCAEQVTILDKMNGTFQPPLPPPHFNDAKMAGFGLRAPSSLLWGGRGLIVPFLFCPRLWNISTTPPPPPISMMLKWRVLVFARLHHCFGGEGS